MSNLSLGDPTEQQSSPDHPRTPLSYVRGWKIVKAISIGLFVYLANQSPIEPKITLIIQVFS